MLALLKRESPCDFATKMRDISSVCHLILVTLCADGRMNGHVTITSLPKFLGLIGYQICLAMVLRWREVTPRGAKSLRIISRGNESKIFIQN